MAVVYISGEIKVHGLDLKTEKEMNELVEVARQAVLSVLPKTEYRLDDDVEIEIDEKAGTFEE